MIDVTIDVEFASPTILRLIVSLFFSQRTLAGLAASSVEHHDPALRPSNFPPAHPRSGRVRKDDTDPFSELGLREPRRVRSRRDETPTRDKTRGMTFERGRRENGPMIAGITLAAGFTCDRYTLSD